MDPVSITAACVGLLSGLISVSTKIRSLTADAKNANKEASALQSELDSFQRSLSVFYGSGIADRYPDNLKADLEKIIRECKNVVEQIDRLLDKVSAGGIGRQIEWSVATREEVSRLQRNLEGHKSAISIAIAFATMQVNSGIKSDTSSIRSKAARIPQIQVQLAALLEALQLDDGASLAQQPEMGLAMQRFLQEAYSESVYGDLARNSTIRSQSIANPFEDQKSTINEDDTLVGSPTSPKSSTPIGQPFSPYDEFKNFDKPVAVPELRNPYGATIQRKPVPGAASILSASDTVMSDSDTATLSSTRQTPSHLTYRPTLIPPLTTDLTREKLVSISSLLSADPTAFQSDPSYYEYKATAQRIYRQTLNSVQFAMADKETLADFTSATTLHQQGQVAQATVKAKHLAEAGHLPSQIMYALALRYGRGCRCDCKLSLAYLYSAARVAVDLELDTGGHLTDTAALDNLRLALFEIAGTFRYTWADSVSDKDAQLFYRASAELGDTKAMHELAWFYRKGIGGEVDKYAGAQIVRQAWALGDRKIGSEWALHDKYNEPPKSVGRNQQSKPVDVKNRSIARRFSDWRTRTGS